MARITHVKSAQPRYRMVPVLDENGVVVRTPVMRKDGTQKTDKRGNPVFMRRSVADKSQPLPLLQCEHCHEPIELGTPYKHVSPKSGPYGGYQRNRHEACPTWMPWDLSNSWSSRVQAMLHATYSDPTGFDTPEEVADMLTGVADGIRELAEESREVASNVEEGFGHPTSVSEEAENRASELDGWADEIEAIDVPELPEAEPVDRWYVVNVEDDSIEHEDTPEGFEDEADAQAHLDSLVEQGADADALRVEQRSYEGDEPTEEQMDQWRSEVEDACEPTNNSPV